MSSNGLGNKEIFAQNLNYYVKRSGKSQSELAEECGVSQSTFNEWCRGKKYPRIDRIERLSEIFKIKMSDLIEEKTGEDTDLSEAKRKLIDMAKDCSDEDAERMLQMMQLFLSGR